MYCFNLCIYCNLWGGGRVKSRVCQAGEKNACVSKGSISSSMGIVALVLRDRVPLVLGRFPLLTNQ